MTEFFDLLPDRKIGIDISLGAPGILTRDFLTWLPPEDTGCIITVGNPPFGKNATKAVSFFNHAARFSKIIAMIVPRTFEENSIQKRLDPWLHSMASMVLGSDAFTFDGGPYDVPTAFQVWVRKAEERHLPRLALTHSHIEFVGCLNADFVLQRVGVGAGVLKLDFAKVVTASRYFLRARGISAEDLYHRLAALDFSDVRSRTAGNPSIAKSELVACYCATWPLAETAT